MPRQRQRRESAKRVFMISSVSEKERNELGKQIKKLGAVYAGDATKFHSNVTHVVCGKLTRSEKFLGALALGSWVVRPEYVTASADAKHWLDEVDYEWSSLDVGQCQVLAVAAKRNRWRASISTEQIFSDWQVAVALSDVSRQNVYKRLLACGGAKVCDVKLPVKDPVKYSSCLTYIFVDSGTVNLTQSLQDCGVICLSADYISDYLVMHPHPDLINYLVQENTDTQQTENTSSAGSVDVSHGSVIFDPCFSTMPQKTSTAGSSDNGYDDEKLVFSQASSSTVHSSHSVNRSSDVDDLEVEVLDFSRCPLSQNTAVISCMDDSVDEMCEELALQEKTFDGVTESGNISSGEEPYRFGKKIHSTKTSFTFKDNKNSACLGSESEHSKPRNGLHSKTTSSISHTQNCRTGHIVHSDSLSMTVFDGGITLWQRPCKDKDMDLATSQSFQTVADARGKQAARCSALENSIMERVSLPSVYLGKDSPCLVAPGSDYLPTSMAPASTVTSATISKTVCTPAASPTAAASSAVAKKNQKREDDKNFTTSISSTSVSVASESDLTTSASSTTPLSSTKPMKTPVKSEHDSYGGVTVCDYKKEIKSLSNAVTAGGTKQALISLGKKVQSSLRGWFSPVGKENGSQGEVVKEVCAHPKTKRGLAAQFQSRNDRDIRTTVRDSHVLSEQKCLQDRSSPKLPVPECVSDDIVQKAAVPETVFEIPEKIVTANTSKGVVPKQFSEECVSAEVLIPKLNAEECASKPSLFNMSNMKCVTDVTLLTKPRIDVASGFNSLKPNAAHVESSSDQNTPDPDLNAPDSLTSDKKVTPSLPRLAGTDQMVLRQPVSNHIAEQDHTVDKSRSSSPDVVLSARPVNNAWVSQRNKTRTQRMTSFMDTVHRKRKSTDLQADESSVEASPSETEQETAVPRRPKTVRGLSQMRSLDQCLQKADSATDLAKKVQISDLEVNGKESVQCFKQHSQCGSFDGDLKSSFTKVSLKRQIHQHPAPLSLMKSHDADSVLKSSKSESLLKRKLYCIESSTNTPRNSSKAQVSQIRWQQSSVRFPIQTDVTDGGMSTVDDMGLRTIPDSICHIVSSCLDENDFQSAISTIMAVVNSCPTTEMIKNAVIVLKKAENISHANQMNAVLNAWLDQFPPVTSTLCTVYEQGLALDDWETFRTILQNAVGETELEKISPDTNHATGTRAHLVLRLVVHVFEKNFLHFAHNANRTGRCNCLVIRLLWSPSYHVYPNSRTRDLMHFLETALRCLATPQACWRELLTLVSMVIQCCHLVDNKWEWGASGQVDRCSGPLVRELAQAITGGGIDSATQLQQVLSCLTLPWLLREVVAVLLEEYDDYLVPGGLTSDCITLKKIVSKYFFLLPKLSALNKSTSASPRKKIKKESMAKDENKAPPAGLTASKINKKNSKGETLLHKAAMKNDISLLKQMLSVPGVDVNAQDFAGWTPLHEACNHGHVECVRALLKFVPSTTLHNFFQSGKQCKVQRVDLTLANEEGITPLHDAVMVNQISTVKLLLKYGGSNLLKAKTTMGLLPVDLASTAEMRQVLTRDNLDLSFSQDSESFSQEMESLENREAVPSSFIYREVLEGDNGTTPFSASLEEARKFLTLLTFLLQSHMKVLKQERQQQLHQQQRQQEKETEDDGGLKGNSKFHAECLRRHMKKITTDEVFSRLTLQLTVLEALLMKNHS